MESGEVFQFVFSTYQDLNKSYFRNVMSTLGFVLLSIGWIITSDKSRVFLGRSNQIRRSSIGGVAVIALIHPVICVGAYFVSAEQYAQLEEIKYVDVTYFEIYTLNALHVALNLVMHLSVFGLLMLLIARTKDTCADRTGSSSEPNAASE